MIKRMSLGAKMTAFNALTALICLGIGITLIKQESEDVVSQSTLEQAEAIGSEQAQDIRRQLDSGIAVAKSLAESFRALRDNGVTDRSIYDALLKKMIETNKQLAGTWAGFEPNALDGKDADFVDAGETTDKTGRYITYYYNFGGGVTPYKLTGYDDTGESGDFYTIPKRTKKPAAIDPVLYDIDGNKVLLVSFSYPVFDPSGTFLGVVGVDVMLNAMSEAISAMHPFETGSIQLVSYKGKWVSNSDPSLLGKPLDRTNAVLKQIADLAQSGGTAEIDDGDQLRLVIPLSLRDSDDTWSVVVNLPKNKLAERADSLSTTIIIGGIILIVVIVLALMTLSHILIRRPLERIVTVVQALDNRDYEIVIGDQDRGDEIGNVSRSLDDLRQNALRLKDVEAEMQAQQARAQEESRQQRLQTADAFEASVGKIVESVSQAAEAMQKASGDMAATAEQSSQQATVVASAANEAAVNVQTVAASAEELSASIHEIGGQVAKSTEIANDAVEKSTNANVLVSNLSESAQRISEVVRLITDVADQTNLLALNATIEAARAGDAGKGFAVVAGEVKNLANQTAKATDEIAKQIGSIQDETNTTVSAIAGVTDTIRTMDEVGATIAAAIEEQAAATSEIANSVHQAAAGTDEVTANITLVKNGAATTESTAQTLQESAQFLAQQISEFKAGVADFLDTIRKG